MVVASGRFQAGLVRWGWAAQAPLRAAFLHFQHGRGAAIGTLSTLGLHLHRSVLEVAAVVQPGNESHAIVAHSQHCHRNILRQDAPGGAIGSGAYPDPAPSSVRALAGPWRRTVTYRPQASSRRM